MVMMFLRLIVLISFSLAASAGKELWLIGGGERVCSSVDLDYCEPNQREIAKKEFIEREALFEKSMQFSAEGLARLTALQNWAGGPAHRDRILDYLRKKSSLLGDAIHSESIWHQHVNDFPGSEDEAQLIDDVFEVRVKTRTGSPKKIEVNFSASYAATRKTLTTFLNAAQPFAKQKQHQKPVVVVLTASSYNVFEYVDYYLELFRQVGADARWLPIEPGFIRVKHCDDLNAQRFAMNGAYDRSSRFPQWQSYQTEFCEHPEKLTQLINDADAIFINGGDQSLTMRSLQNDFGQFTPLALQILDKVEQGIPLGGTSAGTAVQSGRKNGRIPMISDGTTDQAMLTGALAAEINAPLCPMSQQCTLSVPTGQLTYRPLGGLQTFTLGVMDTHFFERKREGRIMRLLADTQTAFGFGVDEATALRVKFVNDDEAQLEVWGEGGVWIADTQKASIMRSPQTWKIDHASTTRLLAGDRANFKNGELSAAICDGKTRRSDDPTIDAEAFATTKGRQWHRVPGRTVLACQREDGRWRYLQLPIGLSQQLNAVK